VIVAKPLMETGNFRLPSNVIHTLTPTDSLARFILFYYSVLVSNIGLCLTPVVVVVVVVVALLLQLLSNN